MIEPRPFQRELECKLTEYEIAARSSQLGGLIHRKNELEDEKKARAKEMQAEIDGMQLTIDRLARECHSGLAKRLVDCEERPNFEANAMEERRLDTGEKIGERALTDEERQLELEGDTGASDDGADAGQPEEWEVPDDESTGDTGASPAAG